MSSRYRFRNLYTTMPGDVQPNDAFAIKIVAVVYESGHWLAYRAQSSWSDERVAREGSELPSLAAVPLFPVLCNLPYGD